MAGRFLRVAAAIVPLVLVACFTGAAGVPNAISYQGKLTDSSGVAVPDGSYTMRFKLFDAQTLGNQLWDSGDTSVSTTGGVFTVQLGTTPNPPINSATLTTDTVWLETTVASSTLPRVKLLSVPFALRSADGPFWSLLGNAGTTPGTNFIGTTDNQPLEFRVNNTRGFRLEPTSGAPNVIGGYSGNTVTAGYYGATISGGGESSYPNSVTNHYGTVGGGYGNAAGGYSAAVGGGYYNTASGPEATVGGGLTNIASGFFATVPGGATNAALGDYSFAAGRRAKANHSGAFVWADATNADFASTAANQFRARASGGAWFYSNSAQLTGVVLAAGSGAWANASDRSLKTNFASIDGKEILAKVAALPMSSWNYKSQDASIRHIGPVAQDFAAAFKVGEDDKHISTIDADGVALAAIQGLYQELKIRDAKIAQQQKQIDEIKALVAALQEKP